MSSRQDVQTKRLYCGTHRRTSAPPSSLDSQSRRKDETHQPRSEVSSQSLDGKRSWDAPDALADDVVHHRKPSNSKYDAIFETVDYMVNQEDPTRAARNIEAMVGQQPRTLAADTTKTSTSFKHRACLPSRPKDQTTGSSTKEDMVDDWVLVSEDEDWDIIPREK